jgi:hypothetical protein
VPAEELASWVVAATHWALASHPATTRSTRSNSQIKGVIWMIRCRYKLLFVADVTLQLLVTLGGQPSHA